MRHTVSVSMVLQFRLVSGWGPYNRRSAPTKPNGSRYPLEETNS